jgi:hypothetical protein
MIATVAPVKTYLKMEGFLAEIKYKFRCHMTTLKKVGVLPKMYRISLEHVLCYSSKTINRFCSELLHKAVGH